MNWALLLLAILADHFLTEYGIRRHGLDIEANPLFRWSWRRFGGGASLLLQAAILLPFLWLAERVAPAEAFLLPLCLWLVVANNLLVLAVLAWRDRRRRKPLA